MKTFFDILKRDRRGTFLWLEAVRDMEAAQTRLRQLSEQSTDEFIVFRNVDLQVVATSRKDETQELSYEIPIRKRAVS
jgi:hypothetical protein